MKHLPHNNSVPCSVWHVFISGSGLQCGNCGAIETTDPMYWEGYKAGRADKALGLQPLVIAITSSNYEYTKGYRNGYYNSK